MNKSNKVTVHDVARVAGVSKSTVSLVLRQSDKASDKAKRKVAAAIEQTGYVYNREAASMRSKSSNLIAIVINDLTNPYSAKLAVALEKQVRKLGFMSMMVNSDECVKTQSDLVAELSQYKIRAFIVVPAPNTKSTWLDALENDQTQVICMMRQVEKSNVPCVLPSNKQGTYLAAKQLLSRGITRLAFIGGDSSISDYHQRLAGFQTALNEANQASNNIFNSKTNRFGGRSAMADCLSTMPDIEGVVCFNDIVAYGVIEQLNVAGLRPGQHIGVIGFDDLDDSELMQVPLSTVRIDADAVAKSVCEILQNGSDGQLLEVPVELIVRDS